MHGRTISIWLDVNAAVDVYQGAASPIKLWAENLLKIADNINDSGFWAIEWDQIKVIAHHMAERIDKINVIPELRHLAAIA